MPQREIAGVTINVNEEGYMTKFSQWTRDIGIQIAREENIGELTQDHWKVIEFLQKDVQQNGAVPTIRRLQKVGGIPTKLLYQLYPGGPLKKACKIAGLPKPESCV